MNWVKHGKKILSYPYQIYHNVRGYEVWIFSKTKSGVSAREVPNLDLAKIVAEKHALKVSKQ
jgi:hypothetical protein